MLDQMKTAYANSRWVRIVAGISLFLASGMLLLFAGGFPPWAWRFLLQTLPQVPALVQARGNIVFVPLFGLIVLSLAILILWCVIVTAWINMLIYWYRERQARQQFAVELQEAEVLASQETERQMRQTIQPSHYERQEHAMPPLIVSLRDRIAATPTQTYQAVGGRRASAVALQRTTPPPLRLSALDTQTLPDRSRETPLPAIRSQLRVVPPLAKDEEIVDKDTIPESDYEAEEFDTVPIALDSLLDDDELEEDELEEESEPDATALRYVIGIASDPGLVRKNAPNEDNLLAIQGTCITPTGTQPVGLFVVADGMGGHANGREASRLAIQAFSDVVVPALLRSVEDENIFVDMLKDGVHRANLNIYQRNRGQESMMGTTITAALLVGAKAYVANVGDSRTYIYKSDKHTLAQVTRDHSHVALLVEKGSISHDDIYTHPRRNQIYRCLGEHASVQIDIFEETLTLGDGLLLCSDGLWEMVRDPTLEKILQHTLAQPTRASEQLLDAALKAGGADNVSMVVVYVGN